MCTTSPLTCHHTCIIYRHQSTYIIDGLQLCNELVKLALRQLNGDVILGPVPLLDLLAQEVVIVWHIACIQHKQTLRFRCKYGWRVLACLSEANDSYKKG